MEKRNDVMAEGLRALGAGFIEAEADRVSRGIALLEKVLTGDTGDEIPVGLEDTFSGVVCDEEVDSKTLVSLMKKWLEGVVGSSLAELVVKKQLKSEDGKTKVVVFAEPIGEMEYFLSTWVDGDEKPRYVLWPMEMYDGQFEAGYTEEES